MSGDKTRARAAGSGTLMVYGYVLCSPCCSDFPFPKWLRKYSGMSSWSLSNDTSLRCNEKGHHSCAYTILVLELYTVSQLTQDQ